MNNITTWPASSNLIRESYDVLKFYFNNKPLLIVNFYEHLYVYAYSGSYSEKDAKALKFHAISKLIG